MPGGVVREGCQPGEGWMGREGCQVRGGMSCVKGGCMRLRSASVTVLSFESNASVLWEIKLGCCHMFVVLPQPSSTGEQKTKPTQNSVRQLRGLGLSPDLVGTFLSCYCWLIGRLSLVRDQYFTGSCLDLHQMPPVVLLWRPNFVPM